MFGYHLPCVDAFDIKCMSECECMCACVIFHFQSFSVVRCKVIIIISLFVLYLLCIVVLLFAFRIIIIIIVSSIFKYIICARAGRRYKYTKLFDGRIFDENEYSKYDVRTSYNVYIFFGVPESGWHLQYEQFCNVFSSFLFLGFVFISCVFVRSLRAKLINCVYLVKRVVQSHFLCMQWAVGTRTENNAKNIWMSVCIKIKICVTWQLMHFFSLPKSKKKKTRNQFVTICMHSGVFSCVR